MHFPLATRARNHVDCPLPHITMMSESSEPMISTLHQGLLIDIAPVSRTQFKFLFSFLLEKDNTWRPIPSDSRNDSDIIFLFRIKIQSLSASTTYETWIRAAIHFCFLSYTVRTAAYLFSLYRHTMINDPATPSPSSSSSSSFKIKKKKTFFFSGELALSWAEKAINNTRREVWSSLASPLSTHTHTTHTQIYSHHFFSPFFYFFFFFVLLAWCKKHESMWHRERETESIYVYNFFFRCAYSSVPKRM